MKAYTDKSKRKCKAYTSLKQSKKLAEILPLESADMSWVSNGLGKPFTRTIPVKGDPEELCACWSLAALLDVLPTTIGNFFTKNMLLLRMDKGENDFNIWYENFDYGNVAEGLDVIEDNSVDACYEMILKLYEQKLL